MSKGEKLSAIGLILIGFVVVTFISYTHGVNKGEAIGYKNGHTVGLKEGEDNSIKTDFSTGIKLRQDYNKLVEDYNNLRNTTVQYVQIPQYAPRTPVSCTSYSFSEYSSTTNCY